MWVNPGYHLPPSSGSTFELADSDGVVDIELADINGDGKEDVFMSLLESGTVRAVLHPAEGGSKLPMSPADMWLAQPHTDTLPEHRPKDLELRDIDKDGFLDLVLATEGQLVVYFGDAVSAATGNFMGKGARSTVVGSNVDEFYPQAIEVQDIDGDGWPDIVATADPDHHGDSSHKRIFHGSSFFAADRQGWQSQPGVTLGPSSEDAWDVELIESVDLNGDGNLDLVYSARGELTRVVLGQSVDQTFDGTAIANQKSNLGGLPLASGGQVIDVQVEVGDRTQSPAGSECRAPADDYYPVRSTLYIEFPIVTCYSPTCILLDPIEMVSETIDNAQGDGLVRCSVDVVRITREIVPAPSPPPVAERRLSPRPSAHGAVRD